MMDTKFGDTEIEKQQFHSRLISISNVDINQIVVSNKFFFSKRGFKHFVVYKDDKKFIPLCIMLQKMSAYRRDFDETKYMSFLIKDDELIKKHNKI